MKLVIIESSAKKKKISKILAGLYGKNEYRVIASPGHIRDLPRKELGVDVENDFRPHYVTAKGKSKTIKMLARHVSDATAVYLATDPDREGEAIAWHITRVTRPDVPVYRVTFNEITQAGVRRAFDNPRDLDMNQVAAQEARRILDRLVGYKVSPALWKGLDQGGLSAGRVQSVALKLVVERQHDIDHFEPQEYWSLTGTFRVPDGAFNATLILWNNQKWSADTFRSKEAAQAAVERLNDQLFTVRNVETKERHRNPPAPFTTSTLQQAASSHLKISPDKTMSVAQALYEAGHITYMRTDSPAVSTEAAQSAADLIQAQYGDVYLPETRPTYRASSDAQEAHLPFVTENQTCQMTACQPEQHMTRAPATYSEASLVRALEQQGIGRPSTYSMMVSVIRQRNYVRIKKRRLVPTALGQQVATFLNTHFGLIVNYDFTRTMETSLDNIAAGELDTRRFLRLFWQKFYPLVEPWDYTPGKSEPTVTDETCPVCGEGQLALRSSRNGRFLGCTRYPACKYTRDVKHPAPVLIGKTCPECRSQLCLRSRRDSNEKFVACTNYPRCKHTESFQTY